MKRIYITIVILLALFFAAFIWWKNGTSPVNPKDNTPKIFIIEQGQGVRAVAKNLKDQGLIKSPVVFFLLTKKLGLDNKIEAGDYRLFPSMSAFDIATGLTHGTLDIWITIPEGQRAGEIADNLKAKMPKFDPSWEKTLEQKEGYLFPDTYLLPRDADIDTIINIMTKNFDSKYDALDASKANLSKQEIVTLASLIEREAKKDEDRPLVASVIHNRLDLGMKLDIDATIQYALGYQTSEKRWWKSELSIQDLKLDSSYNTYLVAGLPPTPISNPGLASLEAAINPAKSDYLYYITDGSGINHYAKTFEQHQANIEKYGL